MSKAKREEMGVAAGWATDRGPGGVVAPAAGGAPEIGWYVVALSDRAAPVAARVARRGFAWWCPVMVERRRCAHRGRGRATPRDVVVPMFAGYGLVRCGEATAWGLAEVDGIACVLTRNGRPVALAAADVARLEALDGKGVDVVAPHAATVALAVGMAVTIAAGPFAGQRGRVARVGRERVTVAVPLLGGEVPVTIAEDAVEAA